MAGEGSASSLWRRLWNRLAGRSSSAAAGEIDSEAAAAAALAAEMLAEAERELEGLGPGPSTAEGPLATNGGPADELAGEPIDATARPSIAEGAPSREPGPFDPQAATASRDEGSPSEEGAEPSALDAQTELVELLDSLRYGPAPEDAAARILALIARLPPHREQQALSLLERAVRLLPGALALQLELAERLYRRRDVRAALPLLHALTAGPIPPPASAAAACRVRAQFLLGDHHQREAELHQALSHYERVLAWDFSYPRARPRADELRSRLDRPLGTAAQTILDASDVGATSRFAILRELGRGGGGAVYLARDRDLDRPVAIKILHPHVARQAEARAHLFCEARIATSLLHPQIVAIYDLDEDLNLVAMEFCAGGTLADRIASGPVPPEQALGRLVEVTSVLEVVHGCGVVHRDLKPANLLLRTASEHAPVVLTDFGTAHAAALEEQTGEVVGSRAYMAPEQLRGAPADPRADLYACGMILVELLLGRQALTHQQALQGVAAHDVSEIWGELRARMPRPARPAVELARRLLDPRADRRPSEARLVAAEARAMSRECEALADRRAVFAELEQRAGAPPRPDAVEQWLAAQEVALGLVDLPA